MLAMLIGGFVFGLIVGNLAELSKRKNPAERVRQQKIAEANALIIARSKLTTVACMACRSAKC